MEYFWPHQITRKVGGFSSSFLELSLQSGINIPRYLLSSPLSSQLLLHRPLKRYQVIDSSNEAPPKSLPIHSRGRCSLGPQCDA